MVELKVRKFGNSLGVILPKELLKRLNAAEGKRIFVIEASEGALRIAPSDQEFE
jgi:putative addiction module antidote